MLKISRSDADALRAQIGFSSLAFRKIDQWLAACGVAQTLLGETLTPIHTWASDEGTHLLARSETRVAHVRVGSDVTEVEGTVWPISAVRAVRATSLGAWDHWGTDTNFNIPTWELEIGSMTLAIAGSEPSASAEAVAANLTGLID